MTGFTNVMAANIGLLIKKIKAGYLEHKVKDIQLPDGTIKITEQVRVTPKGLTKLSKLLGNNNA